MSGKPSAYRNVIQAWSGDDTKPQVE
jgi:hypothetical protein